MAPGLGRYPVRHRHFRDVIIPPQDPSRYSLMARSGFLSAALEHGDVLCVEASGLFIAGRDHQQ